MNLLRQLPIGEAKSLKGAVLLLFGVLCACFAVSAVGAQGPSALLSDVNTTDQQVQVLNFLERMASAAQTYSFLSAADFVMVAVVLYFRKRVAPGHLMLGAGILFVLIGLGAPGAIVFCTSGLSDTGGAKAIETVSYSFSVLLLSLITLRTFVPTIAAFYLKHPKRILVFGLNCLALIPLVWPALLSYVFWKDLTPSKDSPKESQAVTPAQFADLNLGPEQLLKESGDDHADA